MASKEDLQLQQLLESQKETIQKADFSKDQKKQVEEILDDLARKGDFDSRKEIISEIRKQNGELCAMKYDLV